MSAGLRCFLGTPFYCRINIATFEATSHLWPKRTIFGVKTLTPNNRAGSTQPNQPKSRGRASFQNGENFVKSLDENFDSCRSQELSIWPTVAREGNSKYSNLAVFYCEILTPNGKYKQVTLYVYLKTEIKIQRQLLKRSRQTLTKEKSKCLHFQNSKPKSKRMDSPQKKRMNTKSKPTSISPWSLYQTGISTVKEIYYNYRNENIRSRLNFFESSEYSVFHKIQKTLKFSKSRRLASRNPKRKMIFHPFIKSNLFVKFESIKIKTNRQGIKANRLDSHSNPKKDKITKVIVKRTFSHKLILIKPFGNDITDSQDLHIESVDAIIAGAEQEKETVLRVDEGRNYTNRASGSGKDRCRGCRK